MFSLFFIKLLFVLVLQSIVICQESAQLEVLIHVLMGQFAVRCRLFITLTGNHLALS